MEQAINTIYCTGVQSNDLDEVWHLVEDHLSRGLEHSYGELDLDDIYESIEDKTMQLWIAVKEDPKDIVASMVTEVIDYPQMKVARMVVIGGGHMDDWLPFMSTVMKWASLEGCDRLEGLARDGWIRTLKDYGFKKLYSLIGVDLKGMQHGIN